MAVKVFSLCKGAGATMVRAFVWKDVFRGVTPDRLLLTGVDSCRFVGTLREGSKDVEIEIAIEKRVIFGDRKHTLVRLASRR